MSAKIQWLSVTASENIPPREGRAVHLGGRDVAIFNLGDRFLAIDNRCPHKAGPLADGILSGNSVVCPLHAWKIDLETGSAVNHPEFTLCVTTYETRVEEGVLFVAIPADLEPAPSLQSSRSSPDRPIRWVQRGDFVSPSCEADSA